ncbi:MAG: DUF6624 domain-containing protein [Longimicrobiales bacterium]
MPRSRPVWIALVLASLPGCGQPAAPSSTGVPANPALRRELVRLGMLDQTARIAFTAESVTDTALMRAILAVDSLLTARLHAIVREHGWPTRSQVAESGARAAFLIVQHSPSSAFQREVLPLVLQAAGAGEASASDAAMLEDRVLTDEGKPQRFGTQFRIVAGELVPYPIEDPERVDDRRASVGLMPMSEYVKLLEETYDGPVRYPFDRPSSNDTVSGAS